MALTPKRITLLTTAAPVVIEMVRKYWPLIEQKLRENPELLSSVQVQLRRLAALERKKLQDEYKEVMALIKELEALLASLDDED